MNRTVGRAGLYCTDVIGCRAMTMKYEWFERGEWLGRKVSFKLLGKVVSGTVIEQGDNHSGLMLTVEFYDGAKTIHVAGHPAAFKKL